MNKGSGGTGDAGAIARSMTNATAGTNAANGAMVANNPAMHAQQLSPTGQATNGLNASFAGVAPGGMDTAGPLAPSPSVDPAGDGLAMDEPGFWDTFSAIMQEGGAEALADAGAAVGGAMEEKVGQIGHVAGWRGATAPAENPGFMALSNMNRAMGAG